MPFTYTVKKGDTLNKIASQYGFSNYKAAGISSVPSGDFDLIREGEQVTLANYDPNKVATIKEGAPVVSSKDSEQQFRADSDNLQGMVDTIKGAQEAEKTKETETPAPEKKEEVKTETETTEDIGLTKRNKAIKDSEAEFEIEATRKKAEVQSAYQTSLTAIDETAASTVASINAIYDKRVAEQRRINKLNIDRQVAYNIGNATYVPQLFSDALSVREQEAADAITELENKRNSLISEAKAARETGKAKLLTEKMSSISTVEKDIRDRLNDAATAATEQYKLERDYRKELEEKAQKAKEAMIKTLSAYWVEYEGLSPEERDVFVEKKMAETGLDYMTVYSVLEGGVLETQKKQAEIEATKALAEQRRRQKTEVEDDFTDAELRDLKRWGLENAPANVKNDYLKKGGNGIDEESVQDYLEGKTKGGGGEEDPLGLFGEKSSTKPISKDAITDEEFDEVEKKEAAKAEEARKKEAAKAQKAAAKKQQKEFEKKEKARKVEEARAARAIREAKTQEKAQETIKKLFPKKEEADKIAAAERAAFDAEQAVLAAKNKARSEKEIAELEVERKKAKENADALFKKLFGNRK